MIAGYFEKEVIEVFTVAVLYEGRLPSGATVSTGTVECTNAATGSVDNSLIGSTSTVISGSQAKVVILAGTASQDYFLTFVTTLSDGSVLQDVALLKVAA